MEIQNFWQHLNKDLIEVSDKDQTGFELMKNYEMEFYSLKFKVAIIFSLKWIKYSLKLTQATYSVLIKPKNHLIGQLLNHISKLRFT